MNQAAVTANTLSDRNVVFRIEHVRKEYHVDDTVVYALRDASLEIFDNECLVILGPSGSGKSTLLNIIGGIDSPTSGRVLFRDADLTQYDRNALTLYRRANIGFVFQFYNLIPNLTARENVEMAAEISKSAMDPSEALRLVNLELREDHFPSQLSGGEQQRVAIARAVAKRPDILLCDEPTGALDVSSGKVVLEVLADVNRTTNATVVIITHNAVIANMADRVVRMTDGRIRDIVINPQRAAVQSLEW